MKVHTDSNFPYMEIISAMRELMADESSIQCDLNGNVTNGTNNLTANFPQPEIDSLLVVDLLVTLEPIVGQELSIKLIKIGGYHSMEELYEDLLPKLHKLWQESVGILK